MKASGTDHAHSGRQLCVKHLLGVVCALCAALTAGASISSPTLRARQPAREPETGTAAGIRVATRSRSVAPGEIVVFTLTLPRRADRVRVNAFGHDITAFATGVRTWRAIVGIDLDVAPGIHPVVIDADDRLHATRELLVRPRDFPTRRLVVDDAFVNPPFPEQARIEQESARLSAIWQSSAGERLWTAPFVRPVPHRANSRFGTRSVFNGEPRNPHGGADFLSPRGTPVRAPNAGRVALAEPLYFSGNTVIIDHGLGLFSTLAHLSSIAVQEGDLIPAGRVVGRVGATGRVTGPHLHWALRANDARVDPLAVLSLLGRR
jgi:murein DD-endopeptidase MepM/ murein hydrolase activator NlpD